MTPLLRRLVQMPGFREAWEQSKVKPPILPPELPPGYTFVEHELPADQSGAQWRALAPLGIFPVAAERSGEKIRISYGIPEKICLDIALAIED